MKIKVELLFTLLILTFSSILSFVNVPLIPIVKATYVEGSITQDTVWTLVDSPFIISNETVICEGVTLTIEPEVEVRFGGKFSITVEGRLIAEGTNEKMIKFTSNELQPEIGSWGTIRFNSMQHSSLAFCILEYGANGTIVENGSVDIKNSVVQFNSESGITVLNGNVIIEDLVVVNNTMSGIYIAGGQVIVQNNVINSNEDGIVLTASLTSEISISRNELSLNTHSGILYEAGNYENVFIRNNIISSNFYGIYVSTDDATQITENYILNNIVGIFYEKGTEHSAHFNDIYDNDLGMDVSAEAYVNATYNYWGGKSGPWHETLNPRGDGNPVGGDGVNLEFIFFLTHPIDYVNSNPTAVLWTDKLVVAPNDEVTFIGSDSYDDGQVNQYLFDFGDVTNSGWTTLSLFFHSYTSMGTYTASLMVIDDFNTVSPNASTVEVNVTDLPPLDVSVTLSNYVTAHNEEVMVTVYVSYEASAVENANVTLFSVKGGSFTLESGQTDSSGYFVTTFKAPDAAEITDVRIIARASKESYADGSDHKYLKVLPPLIAYVTVDPPTIKSEETATITVYVMDSFGKSVADASLELSCENGVLSTTAGVTDINGTAVFYFAASRTLTKIDAIVTARITKAGFETQLVQTIIPIEPKILVVEVTADPNIIISEATSLVTAHVTCDFAPVLNVTVTISSDIGGNFSEASIATDLDGNATFLFTAPQVTIKDGLNATITATASKEGYVGGESYTVITIKPKILSVQVTTEPNATISEGKIAVTIQVTYNENPISEANITLIPEAGDFFPTFMLSDYEGFASFIFTAPPVDAPRNVTLLVVATKDGYADGENMFNIAVSRGILDVEITVSPSSSVTSEEHVIMTVYVSCEQTPIANANVNVTYSGEIIPSATNLTDVSGRCIFIFDAPQTITQLSIDIIVNATKYGFEGCEKQALLIVNPIEVEKPAEGFPLTTLLLILIPAVIAVVFVVLVKLKIIVISFVEGEER